MIENIPDEVFKSSPHPVHQLGMMECLVLHWDRWGNQLPQCRKCTVCGEWVASGDEGKPCPGARVPIGKGVM